MTKAEVKGKKEERACRIYLITPPAFDPEALRDRLAAALDAGDVAALQLRMKGVDDDTLKRAIDVLRPVAQERGVAFILNDRPDRVRETGCDGAHVLRPDMGAITARLTDEIGTVVEDESGAALLRHRAEERGVAFILNDRPDLVRETGCDGAHVLRPVAQECGVAFILNDRPDLVRETGCDGAHVGAEDMGVAEARRLLGPELTLGASCYASRDLAMRAGEAGADYIAFGAFFPTTTKEAKTRATPDLLTWWSELMVLPVVAIGGITAENCAPLVRAGADFLAVIGAVWQHPEGPVAGVQALDRAIARALDGA